MILRLGRHISEESLTVYLPQLWKCLARSPTATRMPLSRSTEYQTLVDAYAPIQLNGHLYLHYPATTPLESGRLDTGDGPRLVRGVLGRTGPPPVVRTHATLHHLPLCTGEGRLPRSQTATTGMWANLRV